MKMQGNWIGFYEYGEGYSLPHFGERVKFRFSLEDTENGFEGKCIEDDSEISIKEISEVSGFIEDGMISFVNTYSNRYEIDEENIQPRNKIIEGKEYSVNYSGLYDERFDCFYGVWEIDYKDSELTDFFTGGIWKMKKDITS